MYDFIIAGAGCAGLSLAMHLVASGSFRQHKILLLDQAPKEANDRTWCFWQQSPGLFDDIVYHRWPQLLFQAPQFSKALDMGAYTYQMIRGIDFYRHCFSVLQAQPNVDLVFAPVESMQTEGEHAWVKAGGRRYRGSYVFNSIRNEQPKPGEHWLLQHFKGWVIETGEARFHPEQATLMDFRIPQNKGTAFCYVMPFSTTKALVEYTLFTPALLQPEDYDEGLRHYIGDHLGLTQYQIVEEEFGVIPMTDHRFSQGQGRIVNLGTAGGRTKASSGYTFQFIQKHSAAIVSALQQQASPFVGSEPARFHFYDSVLLHILYHNTLPGSQIFTRLFQRNRAAQVLKFLDNETTLAEELRIISTLPTWPFFRAATKVLGSPL